MYTIQELNLLIIFNIVMLLHLAKNITEEINKKLTVAVLSDDPPCMYRPCKGNTIHIIVHLNGVNDIPIYKVSFLNFSVDPIVPCRST